MAPNQPPHTSMFFRALRKWLVSAFVVFTFVAYAVHERLTNADGTASALASTQQPVATLQVTSVPTSAPVAIVPTQTQPSPVPTDVPATQPVPTEPAVPATLVVVAPTSTPLPTAVPPTDAPVTARSQYKDGTYTGPETDAYYGNVQVQVTIQSGKIASVNFTDYPQDRRTSARINSIATPYLVSEAIQAQSANVDIISGATLTSEAFVKSLQSALNAAKA